MTIEERVELYKSLYKECKALEPVANTLAKGYKQADPRKRLELIRELDTELAEVYMDKCKGMRVKPLKIDFRGILYKGYIINAH